MVGKKKQSAAAASSSGVKRTRAETAAVNDDDVFEDGPARARSQQAEPKAPVAADVPGEMDQCRICPRVLVRAVKGLNIQQIRAVQALGFDSLFHLQVETVPPRLLAWCLENFDPITCSIEVPDHAPLQISAEDVSLVFGFPRGPLQIESVSRTRDKALVQEWTTMFEKTQYTIRPSDIAARMKAEVDGGLWFKRLFLMLLESCLFENAADGYVKPKVMDILRDVTKIRDHNWCAHMISCLRRGHERWVDSNHRKFNGPSVFLTLFYVDRVVNSKRIVAREFPLIKGWTTKALRNFENAGFGRGQVEGQYIPPHNFTRVCTQPGGITQMGQSVRREGRRAGKTITVTKDAYTLQLLRAAKTVADSMSNLMSLIVDAPLHIRQDTRFQNVVQTSSLLIGVKGPAQEVPADASGLSCTQRLAADDRGSLEWKCNATLLAEVIDEKERLVENLEDPSFSLGLTQKFNEEIDKSKEDAFVAGARDDELCKDTDAQYHAGQQVDKHIPEADLASGSSSLPANSRTLKKGKAVGSAGQGCAGVQAHDIHNHELPAADITQVDSLKAAATIDEVVKDLNVQHFKKMLDENTSLLAQGCSPTVVKKAGGTGKDETVDDIMNVCNAEPTMLQSQCGIAVGEAHCSVLDQDSDDEPLIKKFKRKSKTRVQKQVAAVETQLPNHLARRKDNRAAADPPETAVVEAAASLTAAADKKKGKALAVEQPGHGMIKRSAAEIKKSSSMLSPFNERAVSVKSRLTNSEKELYQWLGAISEDSESDDLYANDNVMAYRSDFLSLQPQQSVSTMVIDAWTSHLNQQERLRSIESPSRFFFTTFPCSFAFVDLQGRTLDQSVKEKFWNLIEEEMKDVREFKLGNIDMVFFPICRSMHHYVLVVDLKRRKIVLLDSSSAQLAEPINAKYGDIPSIVAKAFCEWMINNDCPSKGRAMQNLKIERLHLPWSNDTNIVDSGVYAMRHMETFMGGRVKDWAVGLDSNAAVVLQALRVRYSKTILTSDGNKKRTDVLNRVRAWFSGLRSVKTAA